jgi:hypothetical protein
MKIIKSSILKIMKFIKLIYSNILDFLISLIIGLSLAGSIYLGFLQRHFFSYRYLAYAIFIAFVGTILSGWINFYVISPATRTISKGIKTFAYISAIFLTLILLLNIKIQPIYYVLPDTRLEINFEIDKLSQNAEGVRLLWIETGQGYVPYTYIKYDGEWERILGNTIFQPNQSVKLSWEGKAGSYAEIAFRKTSFDQPISILWNGTSTIYNLNESDGINLIIEDTFDVSWGNYVPFILTFIISSFYTIFTLMIVAGKWDLSELKFNMKKSYHWFFYAIPMVLFWFLFLAIFWPGVLSNDSMALYGEALNGNFSNSQSIFYEYFLSILLELIQSPAFILGIQIILFALIISWGLSLLERYGVPRLVLWTISLLMAIFPPNMVFSVTLWKDIPYAFSLLLLSIFLLSIAVSKGEWITKKTNWIWLAFVGLLVGALRHNGWPASLLSLLLLPLIFRKFWKYFLGSLLIATFSFLVIEGILFDQIITKNESIDQSNLVYLHHIAAHINAGTYLNEDEEAYLNEFLPLSDWNYDACYVGSIWKDRSFDRESFANNTEKNRKLGLELFLRDPVVNISHMLTSGELSYRFIGNKCSMKSLHGLWSLNMGNIHWVIPNDNNVRENSLLPGMIQPTMTLLKKFGYYDARVVSYLRPAFWLFLAFFSFSVLVIRKENIIFLVPMIPALTQSIVLFLIGFAPAFRYYYSNCLIGIFFLGCVFIPKEVESARL